ncbi:hypothetical protein DL93DRAFT_2088624, partial [Clavulina sp. PMI_390]
MKPLNNFRRLLESRNRPRVNTNHPPIHKKMVQFDHSDLHLSRKAMRNIPTARSLASLCSDVAC